MFNRRKLARERLEIYLVHLLMMCRQIVFFGGILLLMLAFVSLKVHYTIAFASLLFAVYLFLLSYSYNAILYTARLAAFLSTLGGSKD